MAKYRIKRGPLGRSVQYECERCGVPLTSKLADAGSQDSCPECGQLFIVPGEEERKKKPLPEPKREDPGNSRPPQPNEPPAASPASEGAGFEDAVEELLGAAPPSEKHAAESPPPPPPPRPMVSPLPSSNPTKSKGRPPGRRPFSERVLDRAFRIAKGFSVATILVLAALIVLSLSASGLILLRLRPIEAPPVEAPSVAELKTFLAKSEANNDGNEPGTVASLPDESLSPLESIARTHGLSRLVTPLIDRISADLTGDEFSAMLSGLDDVLPRIPADSRDKAAIYFCQQYCDRCEAYDDNLASDSLSNAGTYALSITLLTATLYFFFALMAFIAFPLLIKIERNTKLLAEAA